MRHNLALGLGLLSIVVHQAVPKYGTENRYNNNTAVRQLRFRGFEPRTPDGGGRREARGFHFNASGEDVSVEMEFIVPFVKVPVKRSMQLARDAVHGLLNLHTGALLNMAVIVAAGAIIAGIVRLVLAPLVFTSLRGPNGYGYAKQYAEQPQSRRAMRSLTQLLESQLDQHSIDVSVCAQRAICHYLQQNGAQQPQSLAGRQSLIAGLVNSRSRWLDTHLKGTAVFGAIDVARSSRSCSQVYRGCSWPRFSTGLWLRSWPTLLRSFSGRPPDY